MYEKRSHGIFVKERAPKATGYRSKLYSMRTVRKEIAKNYEKEFFEPTDTHAERAMFVLQQGKYVYRPELRLAWARFMSSLLLRCPEDLELFRKNWSNYILETPPAWEELYAATRKPDEPPTLAEKLKGIPDDESEIRMFRAFIGLIDHQNVLHYIKGMRWGVMDVGSANHKLLTSDRPVIRTGGLKQESGHIALAISPTKLFVGANDYQTLNYIKGISANQLVRENNRQVVEGAMTFVYAHDRSQTAYIEKRFGTNPQPRLFDKFFRDRKRVIKLIDRGSEGGPDRSNQAPNNQPQLR